MTTTAVQCTLAIVALHAATVLAQVRTEPLAGRWRFALDRQDTGIRDGFFAHDLPDFITLPGSLQEQGFGDIPDVTGDWAADQHSLNAFREDPRFAAYRAPGHLKSPCWLTPKRHYAGPAWYQRDIDIPADWHDKRILLHLERPHWQTRVWVDDHEIGTEDSLAVAHDYDLTDAPAGGRHRLTIRIDNRLNIPVGPHAHSVTDMTQTNWNGIIGDISLRATDKVWIDAVRVFADTAKRRVRVVVDIGSRTGSPGDGTITLSAQGLNTADLRSSPPRQFPVHWAAQGGSAEMEYDLGLDAPLWDEFSPALFRLDAELVSADAAHRDSSTTTFGLREISTSGTRFLLNGRPIQFRGTLECCIFPLTGYPPMEVAPWKRILTTARQYGLNHIRFHSWCPPEAAFVAADEMGFYFEVECPTWAKFGDGTAVDKWMPEEGRRMLRAYGNHPSFVMMDPTNEPRRNKPAAFLADVIQKWKRDDPRRLYTTGAGADQIVTPACDFYIEYATRFHQAKGELSRPPQTSEDYRAFIEKQPVPCIAHELGQWCAYPDFDEIPKFSGFLSAGNLEIFRDFLDRSGMASCAHDFVLASGRFQTLLYKAEIEKVLRTHGMGGFELLDLHDFPGQGTSPVGVLDEFWASKGYVTPEEYSRFCNATVPLARFPRRVFTAGKGEAIGLSVSHFGPSDLADATISWHIRDADSNVLQQGKLDPRTIPTGQLTSLGSIALPLDALPAPAQYRLEVAIDGTSFLNDWDFWVYPAEVDVAPPGGITIAHDASEATLAAVAAGASTLVLLPPDRVAGDTHGDFEPIFWNRILFPQQRTHTLGIFCDPHHPALARFPTENHSNWQWWDLQQHCKPMILDGIPGGLRPVVQMIDDWTLCRKLGLVVEARLGKGKLMICSIDLQTDLAERPVARQMLNSLLTYTASEQFCPRVSVSANQIAALVSVSSTTRVATRPADPAK